MKYAVPDQWMKSTLFGDVHSAAELFLKIDKQSPWEPRRAWTGLDQEIDVAVRTRVAPGKGTEHTHPPNAVPGGDGENRGALVLA